MEINMAKLYYHNGKERILLYEMVASGPVNVERFFDLFGENEIMEKVYALPNCNDDMIGCMGLFSVDLD